MDLDFRPLFACGFVIGAVIGIAGVILGILLGHHLTLGWR